MPSTTDFGFFIALITSLYYAFVNFSQLQFIAIAVILSILTHLLTSSGPGRKMPPGPIGIPIFGNMPCLAFNKSYEYDDPKFLNNLERLEETHKDIGKAQIIMFFPWLVPFFPGMIYKMKNNIKGILKYLSEEKKFKQKLMKLLGKKDSQRWKTNIASKMNLLIKKDFKIDSFCARTRHNRMLTVHYTPKFAGMKRVKIRQNSYDATEDNVYLCKNFSFTKSKRSLKAECVLDFKLLCSCQCNRKARKFQDAFIAIAAILSILTHLLTSSGPGRKMPPGPIGIPIFGNMPCYFISDYEMIKEMSNHPDVQHRPAKGLFREIIKGRGISDSEGSVWKHQRRFVLQALRDVGMGKRKLEEKIQDEIIRLCHAIEKANGVPIDLKFHAKKHHQ
ncbi:Cytochrome P450 2C70 [Nymphon striatum]|nr:Cytochrome P450 2C70 [Nymphon striatum]